MSTTYERLKTVLAKRPILLADARTKEVVLLPQDEAFRRIQDAGLFHSTSVMHALKALENFKTLVGETEREFTLKDIAVITGEPYSKINFYVTEKLIEADGSGTRKERKFTWAMAFVAGVCGSLRRNGTQIDLVRSIRRLLIPSSAEKVTEKKKVLA